MHLVYRLEPLVADDEVVYVDSDLDRVNGESGGIVTRGRVLLMTADRVVLGTVFEGADNDLSLSSPQSTVEVSTWSRAALVKISVLRDDRNRDAVWKEAWPGLPGGSAITLDYGSSLPALNLPLRREATGAASERLREQLPALFADLSR